MVEEGNRAADSTIEAWGGGISFIIKNMCLLANIIALIVDLNAYNIGIRTSD